MEPFSINCTTCHAALKVRKPEAIGQIYACPSCGGMVLIERPAPVPVPSEDHSVESNDSAAHASAMNGEAPASRPTVRKRKRRHSNDADLAKLATAASGASYDQVDSLLGDPSDDSQPAASTSAEPASQEFTFSSSPVQDSPVVAPIGPNQDWSSEATSKSRTYVFYLCLLYTSPSPRDQRGSRMPSSA